MTMKRRTFLGTSAATTAATTAAFNLLPSFANPPNKSLSVAFIGMGGQIQGHVANTLNQGHHAAAFCDVDPNRIRISKERHGERAAKAAEFADYRKLIETGGFDAAVVATPDHWHAPIVKALMKADIPVYCEKPLTHTIGEARELRTLSRQSKGVTQMGNQGSASSNLRRSIELIQADVFGPVREVHVWHPSHSWPNGVKRPDGKDAVPSGMNWDFWCGPAPLREYKNGIYHPGAWRGWYDFGNGALGDFCCHSFNLALRALHLDQPSHIRMRGEGLGEETFARSCTVSYTFEPNDKRDHAVRIHFYTGGGEDVPPEYAVHAAKQTFGGGKLPREGAIMIGDKGCLNVGLWNSQCYVKMAGEQRYLGAGKHEASKDVPQSLPRVHGHMQEWFDAIRGEGKTFADFEHGGHLTEIGLIGILALKLQKDIEWDGENMKVVGEPSADALINKPVREKWL